MTTQLSRRNFLSTTAKSAIAVATYNAMQTRVGAVSINSIITQGNGSSFHSIFSKLDEYIARHMQETGAPGMTLALANREGPVRISTYGLADIKANTRVSPATMFQICSISKSFVGLTLLQLRDEGKVDFHKPVVNYLPWLQINSKFEPITTHHLLSHSTGLPGAPLLLDALLGQLSTAWAPGKRFLYCNTGDNILGFLIEAVDN